MEKLSVATIAVIALLLLAAPGAPEPGGDAAAAPSAFTDPAAVDWGARLEGARAGEDVNQYKQILAFAPLPDWIKVVDAAVMDLTALSESPNLDQPGNSPSLNAITAGAPAENAPDAIVIAPETAVPQGKMLLVDLVRRLPKDTAKLSFTLRPPVEGMKAELSEMTLNKTGGEEFVTASMFFLVGPDTPPGAVDMTGGLTSLGRNGAVLADIPLEVHLEVLLSPPDKDRLAAWQTCALAHRWMAAHVRTASLSPGVLESLMSGDQSAQTEKNRAPDARKHDLVAFLYGEMLRQVAGGIAYDPALRDAAVVLLRELEGLELRRAQYEAAAAGKPLPAGVEAGYWWNAPAGGSFDAAGAHDRRDLPPRYR